MPKPNARFRDITGQTFGMMTAVKFLGYNRAGRQEWLFRCSACGAEKPKSSNLVTTGKGGCGCRQFAGNRRTHGKHEMREYAVWKQMKQRCYNPNAKGFHNYGGRGITVCSRWRNSFVAFLNDMGPAPGPGYTVEREDNDKGYGPDNCRWATRVDQSRNKRDNHTITYKGRTQTVTDWATELGVNRDTLFYRIRRGWTPAQTIETPVIPGQKLRR